MLLEKTLDFATSNFICGHNTHLKNWYINFTKLLPKRVFNTLIYIKTDHSVGTRT